MIDNEGDLMDTYYDPLRSLYQEIKTRVAANPGDWRVFPTVGAAIGDLVGEANNPETAQSIIVRIRSALARDGFINTGDMKVQVMPIGMDKLLLRLSVEVAPTAKNASSELLVRNLVYSYSDNNVYFVGA